MNRWVFCFAMVFVGCVASIPPGDTSITADLAVEGSRAAILSRREIRPAPPVPPSDQCDRCEGRGYIGDQASIRIKCPACDGTGKRKTTKPACPTGSCTLP